MTIKPVAEEDPLEWEEIEYLSARHLVPRLLRSAAVGVEERRRAGSLAVALSTVCAIVLAECTDRDVRAEVERILDTHADDLIGG